MVSIKMEWQFKPNTKLGFQGNVFCFSKFMQPAHKLSTITFEKLINCKQFIPDLKSAKYNQIQTAHVKCPANEIQ